MELKLEKLNFSNRHYIRGLLLLAFSLLLIIFSLVPPPGYALSLPATARFNPAVQVPLQNANTTTTSSATTTTATTSTTSTTTNSSIAPEQSQLPFTNWAPWQAYMANVPAPQAGCFVATYPNPVWQKTPCVATPSLWSAPSHTAATPSTDSAVVGNGYDYVAEPSGTCPPSCIGSSIGSFQTSGLKSETDVCVAPACSGVATEPNSYSLQLNTQGGCGTVKCGFPIDNKYTGNKPTTGWVQFVWATAGTGTCGTLPCTCCTGGHLVIGIALNSWNAVYCPSTPGGCCDMLPPPPEGVWKTDTKAPKTGGDCTDAIPGVSTPYEPPTSLSSLSLGGFANFGGQDEAQFWVNGKNGYVVSIPTNFLDLYEYWNLAEFNVFGRWGRARAEFDGGTTITVSNALKDQDGNEIIPLGPPAAGCPINGQTGETNNLNMGSCSVSGNSMVFTESNVLETLRTGVASASGSGSVSPNCPKGGLGCLEEFGSEITVRANPSPGWVFADWSSPEGISCLSTNPCTFSMPLNSVTLEAAFVPVMTVSYVVLGGGNPPAPTFNYVQGGVPKTLTLTTTPVHVAESLGSETTGIAWYVTPNPISGSLGEQWITTQATEGKWCSCSIVFKYQHQYYLTMQVNPSGGGSTTPSKNGWYKATQKVTIGATAKTGYSFLSWTGSGAGSYSGPTASTTITMNAPITETANFGKKE